jgi:hypothetical protein
MSGELTMLFAANCRAHGGFNDKHTRPTEGELGICMQCGELAKFSSGAFVPIDADQVELELEQRPGVSRMAREIRRAIAARISARLQAEQTITRGLVLR